MSNTNTKYTLIEGENMLDIASAVHDKTGITKSMTVLEMAQAIKSFEGGSLIGLYLSGELTHLTAEILSNLPVYYPPSNPDHPGTARINAQAFYKCINLKTVELPENLKNYNSFSIEGNAFFECTGLESVKFVETNYMSIGSGAFNGCTSLTSLTFEPGLEFIASHAFDGCTALKTVAFKSKPDSEYDISNTAFEGCTALTDIYVPWSEGDMKYEDIKWGAPNATVHFNTDTSNM